MYALPAPDNSDGAPVRYKDVTIDSTSLCSVGNTSSVLVVRFSSSSQLSQDENPTRQAQAMAAIYNFFFIAFVLFSVHPFARAHKCYMNIALRILQLTS